MLHYLYTTQVVQEMSRKYLIFKLHIFYSQVYPNYKKVSINQQPLVVSSRVDSWFV